jgi:formylglycine-generating enzyme required for sulfatase activity
MQIYRNGNIIDTRIVSEIDSITFTNILVAPASVTATLNGSRINVSWSNTVGAMSYEIYRSGNNTAYALLAANLTATSYTDNTPLAGTNYYKVKAVSNNLTSGLSNASAPVTFGGAGVETGLYMGVIGFNQSLKTKDISLLNTGTKASFNTFVNSLTSLNGTILYYAVDNAIDKLVAATLPADLVNAAIITFTDGLDQGSHMLNGTYQGNDAAYLTAVNNRIRNTQIQGLPVSAYSIGIRGNDVSDITQFQANLQKLASSPENATEVTSMEEVNAKFQKIADMLYNESSTKSISLKIPGQANGTRIRFTFDNVNNAANSTLYIEGVYSFANKSLQNVTYRGLSSGSGSTVTGTVDGIFVSYTFEDIKLISGAELPTSHIQQWGYITSTSTWQINSEFTNDGNTEIIVDRKSAVIMLALDCSSSLGSQFSTMQTNANAFINKMADSAGSSGGGGGNTGFTSFTETVKGVQFDMLAVEGSTFTMGSTTGGDSDERPTHSVTLSNYYIGKHEVTQALWTAVMGSNPSYSGYGIGANYPVNNVSWNDVQTFIQALNTLTGKTYCLPTEAEWEFAARGGKQSAGYTYSGSNTIGNVAWYSGNSGSISHPVGTKAPNELGIYDMSGNVWEWCSDCYGSYSSSAQQDPAGASSGSDRVSRGGSWSGTAGRCRVASRNYDTPGDRYRNLGFRLARSSK